MRKIWTYATFHVKLRGIHRWPSELRNRDFLKHQETYIHGPAWAQIHWEIRHQKTDGLRINCMTVVNQGYASVHRRANESQFSRIFRSGKSDLWPTFNSLPAYFMQPMAKSLFFSFPRISQLHFTLWYLSYNRLYRMHEGTRGGAAVNLTDDTCSHDAWPASWHKRFSTLLFTLNSKSQLCC